MADLTLVVGDIHGCAQELSQLIELAGASRVVAVGDLFTKGPDPSGVWALICAWKIDSVLGNHDHRLLRLLDGATGDASGRKVVRQLDMGADPQASDWRGYLRRLPLFLEIGPWIVVHAGLHPNRGMAGTSKPMATRMRRWPEESPSGRHWHEQYDRPRPVVFGHDAQGGLVLHYRNGRPHVVGLDTGCVYGGRLSGWLLEEERLVSIPAARAYHAIRR